MQTYHKQFLRAAGLICQQLPRHSGTPNPISLPVTQWNSLVELAHNVQLAQAKSWHHAARCRQDELSAELEYFQQSLARLSDQLRERQVATSCSTEGDVYRDLVALDEEFSDVQCDLESHLVLVTTGPIVLEGINLGRFQIRLDWQSLQEPQPYTVVALDPHPAESNESVTHPHVSEETLCEGDGRRALRAALAAGRLADFFTIVDRLLNTYAEGRAYVELAYWDGVACRDCGTIVASEDRWSCDLCEETICSDCSSHCPHCERTCCAGCSVTCPLCDEPCCTRCQERCPSCGHFVCPDCLLQKPTHCIQCHEEPSDETENDSQASPTEDTNLAVHPNIVGQTTVPT